MKKTLLLLLSLFLLLGGKPALADQNDPPAPAPALTDTLMPANQEYVDFCVFGDHLIALGADGTVSCMDLEEYYLKRRDDSPYDLTAEDKARLKSLTHVTAIRVGGRGGRFAALREDGTVETFGNPCYYSCICDESEWTEIQDVILFLDGESIGLKRDGTIVTNCAYIAEALRSQYDWQDIDIRKMVRSSCACGEYLLALKQDGTVLFADIETIRDYYFRDSYADSDPEKLFLEQRAFSPYEGWSRIVPNAVDMESNGWLHLLLCEDGHVSVSGEDRRWVEEEGIYYWENIVQVWMAGESPIVGLTADGRIVYVAHHTEGLEALDSWRDVRRIVWVQDAYYSYPFDGHTITAVGLTSDGSVLVHTTGELTPEMEEMASWTDLVSLTVDADGLYLGLPYLIVGRHTDGSIVTAGLDQLAFE